VPPLPNFSSRSGLGRDPQPTENLIMSELTLNEMDQVSGGIIPVLIGLNIVIWTAVALK
jgi:lactobin A/cerein 7B family class IIb bacteriocin